MGAFLLEEKKYTQALTFYLATFYIDISGMGNGNCVDDFSIISIIPGIIDSISNLISICKINYNEVNAYLADAINTYCNILPFSYYSADISFLILKDALDGKIIDFSKYPYKSPKSESSKYDYFGYCPPYSNTTAEETKIANVNNETSTDNLQNEPLQKSLSHSIFWILIIIGFLLYILTNN